MLIGIWGPFAVGKTTFLNAYMCRHADGSYKNVSFVFADLAVEYHWSVRQRRWVDERGDEKRWKGLNTDKVAFIDDAVADDKHIWVVESARYFSGMYECLVEVFQRYDGGIAFLLPVTDGETMKIFMKKRCEEHNKAFNEGYWDDRRIAYEAGARYTNSASKQFTPNLIPWVAVQIERDRKQFSAVGSHLTSYIQRPVQQWYGVAERWAQEQRRLARRSV